MASSELQLPAPPPPLRGGLASAAGAAALRAAKSPWLLGAAAALALVVFWRATGSTPVAFVHLWTWGPALLHGLIDAHPLGTVITHGDGGLDATHPEISRAVGNSAEALIPVADRMLRFPLAA